MIFNKLETTDIFRGAFFMCMGSSLTDVRFRTNGKQIASFMFIGADLDKLDKDYMNGHALVNPVQFKESLNRLRDILFEKLRDNNRRDTNEKTRYAESPPSVWRNRKRKDRAYQKRR